MEEFNELKQVFISNISDDKFIYLLFFKINSSIFNLNTFKNSFIFSNFKCSVICINGTCSVTYGFSLNKSKNNKINSFKSIIFDLV